jgi:hypothetical protein
VNTDSQLPTHDSEAMLEEGEQVEWLSQKIRRLLQGVNREDLDDSFLYRRRVNLPIIWLAKIF